MIDKDIEISRGSIDFEKLHFGAGRTPVGHEQSPSSGPLTGGGGAARSRTVRGPVSAIAAPCSASGVHSRVGIPLWAIV